MSEFTKSAQRKARKRYFCDLCNEPILPGKAYIHTTDRTTGGFFISRTHIHCDAIINDYITDATCDCYFDTEAITEQYAKKACTGCERRRKYDDGCGANPISCPEAARRALHPTVLSAVLESIEDYRRV